MFQATNQTGILQGESTKADLLECIVTNGYKWLVNWDLTTKCRDITGIYSDVSVMLSNFGSFCRDRM